MKIFSSKRTKRAVITSALMLTIASGGIGVGLYMNSQSGSSDTRSSAGEDISCVPGEESSCTKIFGTCSATGTKTCSSGATWGLCKADDPRVDSCSGKDCGDDGCGGVCGVCDSDNACSEVGTCAGGASAANGNFTAAGGMNIQVKIALQARVDQSKDLILLELIKEDVVVDSQRVSSGTNGVTRPWNVSDLEIGSYSIRVKPQGFISQVKDITLSDENAVVEFADEFLAGDIVGGSDFWGDDVVKTDDLDYLTSVYMTQDSLADLDGDGYVKSRDKLILESNLLKYGTRVVE